MMDDPYGHDREIYERGWHDATKRAGEREQALQLRVVELERERDAALAKTYKRAAEEISLDIEAGYAASVRQVEALQHLLRWARTCVPFPSDCHAAIDAALSADEKD